MRVVYAAVLIAAVVVVCGYLYLSSDARAVIEFFPQLAQDPGVVSFQALLLNVSRMKEPNDTGIVYLSSVDSAYLPMAINLYKTSYAKLGIRNYLFVCSDKNAHETLHGLGINSVQYLSDKSSNARAIYGTKEFARKTHLKTKIILDGLRAGLTVIIVDVDIIFFKDPVPYLDCKDCDIQIQSDVVEGNSGFYMARPTVPAVTLHQRAWKTALQKGERISNQKVVDREMESMQRAGKLNYKTLDKHKFPSGLVYFEDKRRMFYWDNPPSVEVILHNNWIVSMEAKRYRFKELLLWQVDTGGYYSDPRRRYLAYENPKDFGESTTQRVETDALMTAFIIGDILNRTVILPTFTCHRCSYGACKVTSHKCTFNTHYMIATFDATWGDRYREHVFLDNPLVPETIKKGGSERAHLINRPHGSNFLTPIPKDVEVHGPASIETGPTATEIRAWFGSRTEPVLRFHSLYNILDALRTEKSFAKVKNAINEHTDYRQYNK